jgi:uncharacterized radical SAM superfamily Fe-S cluster-containing enzyme
LQFDSLREGPLRVLRGVDLRDVRLKALERLNQHNISTTLVVTLKKGVNDGEIGEIIDFALKQRCVRGVTFQPIQSAGRLEEFDPARDRLTLGEVRQQILRQQSIFKPRDLIPVPCHPDCLTMAYASKIDGCVTPLTGVIDPKVLLHGEGNTIVYERSASVRGELLKVACCTAENPQPPGSLKQLLCCLPMFAGTGSITYDNVFRIIIMQFLDAHNFDVRAVKKTCVHIVHPDGRIIPFDTFNMFYRDEKERRLEGLRDEQVTSVRVRGKMVRQAPPYDSAVV